MDSLSNPTITHDDELDRFLDAPDEFYYDCMPPTRRHSHRQYSSPSANPSAATLRRRNHRNSNRSDVETEPSSSSSNGFKLDDVIESTKDLIDLSPPEKDDDFAVTDSGQDRVDPIQESGEKTEESVDVADSDRVQEGVSLTEESLLIIYIPSHSAILATRLKKPSPFVKLFTNHDGCSFNVPLSLANSHIPSSNLCERNNSGVSIQQALPAISDKLQNIIIPFEVVLEHSVQSWDADP
ncbi:hypothetical protein F2Q68_00005811 [Brassica cretica]|uniref:Uncharacterized protein n=1 Tax=Brassica cretica TaxID=69181 RepID=A0A8S9JI63_BRACR|nr:hypothetical protein F2Q68_00005811 [Brassica cretica]